MDVSAAKISFASILGNAGKPLFVLEMANNHMGSVDHGIRIVEEMAEAVKGFDFHFGIKLQYRDLDTFIHPDFRDRMDVKYVKRFQETRLTEAEFKKLKNAITAMGMKAVCTPFDEVSVDRIESHGFDILKIASCSLTDWPLLERIAQSKLPVIFSTAAMPVEEIDKVVSFFEHRQKPLAIMHCVAEYPTPKERLQLNQIALLKNRYPAHAVGYSTHENPDNVDSVKIAIGLGAEIFEKHVGVPTETIKLNAYSATPGQVRNWLLSAVDAMAMCGVAGSRHTFGEAEIKELHALRRGVFAKRRAAKGEEIDTSKVFYAIPGKEGQLTANDMSKYTRFAARSDIEANSPVMSEDIERTHIRDKVSDIVQQVRKFIKKSRLPLPGKVDLEISHHYGIEKFHKTGAILLNIVNREYCKKLIVMLPGQGHPTHFHKLKEETFHVQYGEMTMTIDGKDQKYKAGDLILVPRECKHSFATGPGVIFEEISSTHYKDDSYYADESINHNEHRKTLLTYWME